MFARIAVSLGEQDMDTLFTAADCLTALKSWRSLGKLANSYIANALLATNQLIQNFTDKQLAARTMERAETIQTVLRGALEQVALTDTGSTSLNKSVDSLVIYQRFVLGKAIEEVKRTLAISGATLFRYQQNELAALALTLSNIVIKERQQRQKRLDLPPCPDVLIGREHELVSLKSLLLTGTKTPITVIVGAAGMGKTTLAFALANDEEILRRYSDGVLWCSVGHAGQPQIHLLEWSSKLSAGWTRQASLPHQQLREILASIAQDKKILFLIDDVWSIEDFMSLELGGTYCAYLVTTRQSNIAWRLPNANVLPLDDLQPADAADLLTWHLFQTASPPGTDASFQIDIKSVIDAIGTCPLSVSIVGQNLRRFVLSKEAWRFQAFLRSTAQSAHTRVTSELIDKHGREDSISRRLSQTLDTLPAKEQAVLAALSILPHRPGYFTVDEACVIADCSTSALEKLSDAGLIQTFDQNLLMIHQTVAEFATQLLRETSCYARMANYFSELVLTLNTQQISARMSVFVSALAAAEKTTLFNAYCTIANALFPLLEASGQYDLALQMLLKAGKAADTAVQRAVTLANLARIHLLHQHYELASETARQALSMIGELGNPNIRANCYYTLADAEWSLGNKKSSTEFAEKAIALLSVIDHPYTISLVGTLPSRLFTERLQQRSVKQWLSWMHQALKPKQINEQNCLMLSGLAFLKFQMGHGEQADEQVKQVIDIATTNDFRLARLTGLAFRAWIHHHLSLYGSSDEFALEVVSTDYVLVPDAVVMAHSILSLNAMARGEFSAAEMFAKSIQPFSSQRSARLLSLVVDVTLIRVKIAMGRLVEARENSNSLLHSATASHIKEITGIAHALLGLIETRECNLFEAERHLSRSRSWLMEQITGPWFTLFYRICRGEYLLASNQTEAAYQEFNKVFVTGKRVQCPEYQAKAFLGMARAASQKNEINSATKFATESKNLFSELGHVNASYAHEWLQLPRRTDLIHAPLVI